MPMLKPGFHKRQSYKLVSLLFSHNNGGIKPHIRFGFYCIPTNSHQFISQVTYIVIMIYFAGPEKVLVVNSNQTVIEVEKHTTDTAICNMEIKVDGV